MGGRSREQGTGGENGRVILVGGGWEVVVGE